LAGGASGQAKATAAKSGRTAIGHADVDDEEEREESRKMINVFCTFSPESVPFAHSFPYHSILSFNSIQVYFCCPPIKGILTQINKMHTAQGQHQHIRRRRRPSQCQQP
jgi:hypothetical protein